MYIRVCFQSQIHMYLCLHVIMLVVTVNRNEISKFYFIYILYMFYKWYNMITLSL